LPVKILLVCLGNICRSPAAENILQHLADADGLALTCDSAGTSGYHEGSPPDWRMSKALRQKGYPDWGRARRFVREDFEKFDLILAMDEANYRDILALDPQQIHANKVHLICEYCTVHRDRSVPDPYYGGTEGFNYVIELLTDACTGLLASLSKETLDRKN